MQGRSLSGTILLLLCLSILAAGCATYHAADISGFTSDGCSLFPDGNLQDRTLWCECCFRHDKAYWQGGTEDERLNADRELRECVYERTHSKVLADLMYDGVRAGGNPAFPAWYRWAYGWKYGRGYAPLTEQEKAQVLDKLKAYFAKHPQGYCAAR